MRIQWVFTADIYRLHYDPGKTEMLYSVLNDISMDIIYKMSLIS
jgi:hypothetical protein